MSDTPVSEIRSGRTKLAAAWRGRVNQRRWLGWAAVHWILTGMLIVASLATAAFTGYLMRRLFTLEPGAPDTAAAAVEDAVQPTPDQPAPDPPAPAQPATAGPAAQE
jgi:hypothetical protein